MKRLFLFAISALVMCSVASAQTADAVKERKQLAKMARTELNARAGREARKAARELKKAGWIVAPGQLPLEKQLDKAFVMRYEYDDNGYPKWLVGEAKAVGGAYDAARMQAIVNAKTELAGLITTEVAALTDTDVSNNQMTGDDAVSVNKAVQAGKSFIAQKIGRTLVITECYRQISNKTVEVSVTVAYNYQMAMDMAKSVIRKSLEEEGKDLHNQLDNMWGVRKE